MSMADDLVQSDVDTPLPIADHEWMWYRTGAEKTFVRESSIVMSVIVCY